MLVWVVPVVVAAPLDAAPNTVAPTAPPASSEPAIAAVMTPLRMGFIVISLHWRISSRWRLAPTMTGAPHSVLGVA
jgi:hypothetical protein